MFPTAATDALRGPLKLSLMRLVLKVPLDRESTTGDAFAGRFGLPTKGVCATGLPGDDRGLGRRTETPAAQ